MALGDSYATLTELKDRLSISDTVDDTKLTNTLAAASRGVEKYCGRQFNQATSATSRVFWTTTNGNVWVDDFFTTSGLIVKSDDAGNGTYTTTWATSDYLLLPVNGVIDGEIGWPYNRIHGIYRRFTLNSIPNAQITAQWGWSSVPTPVKEACLIAAEETFKLKDAPFAPSVRVAGNPHIEAMLQPYRRLELLVG